ncbi:hypothetical protein RB653_001650 [Dictyostelium firmibasis]|uniref:FNIP repeat-containing protein n=1 Tax=Dictyostelium firmibasis TaxID=79012 RepID=A0AAN7UH19_9MYCE
MNSKNSADLSNDLFYKVWNNIVIFRNIFRYVRIYKKNEKVEFKSRKELLEYTEREFINSLVYSSRESLEIGDLPINYELKEVELTQWTHSGLHGSIIPFGVEILKFPWSGNNRVLPRTQISTFPSSLKNIDGIFLGINIFNKVTTVTKPKKNKQKIQKEKEEVEKVEIEEEEEEEEEEEKYFTIPPNIENVFLNYSTNISGVDNGEGYVVLSKGLKEIAFDCYWYNQNVILRKGDFPDGVTTIGMYGYQLKNIINKDILPSSIRDLSISYGVSKYYDDTKTLNSQPGTFDVLPSNIEILNINSYCKIDKSSLLYKCNSIKNLKIYFSESESKIYPGSLPPNLTHLSIESYKHPIKVGIIPFGVKSLSLEIFPDSVSGFNSDVIEIGAIPSSVESLSLNDFINQPELFPPSLTHLTYTKYYYEDDDEVPHDILLSFFSLLPKSITFLKLNKTFKHKNLKFPPTIKKIEF